MEERASSSRNQEWLRISGGCTMLAGALLLLAGKRRAGLLTTAAGTVLTVLDQKETVKECWNALPGYLETAQQMLDEAQHTIDDIAAKRDKVMSLLGRQAGSDS
jgi:uncharacterized protein YjeT (DUF2065 family)